MAFRSSAGATFQSGTSTITTPVPAGAQTNDIAILYVYHESNVTVTPPAGFTALTPTTNVSARGYVSWFWKRLSSNETGTWSSTLSASGNGVAWAVLFSGRDTSASPFDFTPVVHTDASVNGAPTALSGTATAGSDAAYGFDEWNGTTSDLSPTGWTGRINTIAGVHLSTRDNVSAGTLSAQAQANGSSNTYWTTLAVIKAASTAPEPNSGSASGGISWDGHATGSAIHSGGASGGLSWAGAAAGSAGHSGSAAGALTWAGEASGSAAHSGAATGAVDWASTAEGSTAHSGSASGGIAWAGSASGTAPGVGAHQGSATGGIEWSGTVVGSRPSRGAAAGGLAWAGTVEGSAAHSGSAVGAVAWAGSASGSAKHSGSAVGGIVWTGKVNGPAVARRNITVTLGPISGGWATADPTGSWTSTAETVGGFTVDPANGGWASGPIYE